MLSKKSGEIVNTTTNCSPTTIAIIGTGYVGMASAIGFAELGHKVIGCDILPERIENLRRGITPYREAGIEVILKRNLQLGRLHFVTALTEAIASAEFIAIAVGTPSLPNGEADLSAVADVIAQLSQLDCAGKTIVLRSTVPPGTTRRLAHDFKGKAEFLYAPEFLREGTAVTDFMNPDRIVVGTYNPEAGLKYVRLFGPKVIPSCIMDFSSAELAKGMSNAFLALKISFANEVANLCDFVGADSADVLAAIGADHRIGSRFLHPGIGFGGPCFEKDVTSLTHVALQAGAKSDLLAATLAVNARQPYRVIDILESECGNNFLGMRIGIWGLTYKAGTDDVRTSLAVKIMEHLLERHAEVQVYDPGLESYPSVKGMTFVDNPYDAAQADVLLVLTDWPLFATINPQDISANLRRSLVIDGRNLLNPEAYAAASIRYRGIGRQRARANPQADATSGVLRSVISGEVNYSLTALS